MTLIEITMSLLLIVVLASYALPTYREYIARGHRQMAIDAVHAMALHIEIEGGFEGLEGHAASDGGSSKNVEAETVGMAAAGRGWIPATGQPIYRLRVENRDNGQPGPMSYSITAEPVANGPRAGDRCGVFFLDASGLRGNRARRDAARDDNPATSGCWQGR